MSASAIGGAVGAQVGSLAAGTFGLSAATWTQIGWTAGVLIGTYLFAPDGPDIVNIGPRLDDLKVTSSAYGKDMAKVFGSYRISGNIIWSTPIVETKHVERQEEGKGGGGGSSSTIWYTYSVTFAVALCEGPISGVRRIWFDNALVYDNGISQIYDNITVYNGDDAQEPNWLMQAENGSENTPAYRHTAYILFNSIQLENSGNRIPNVTAEVVKSGVHSSKFNKYVDNIVPAAELYLPPRQYGYGSNSVPDINLDGNFFYVPMQELNIGSSGPNIHVVKMDMNLNHIDTKILNFGVTGNLSGIALAVSDSEDFIYAIYSFTTNTQLIITDTIQTAFVSNLLPIPASDFTKATVILLADNKNIFLYDSSSILTKDVPLYIYSAGVCDITSCNILSEWLSATTLSGMRSYKLYVADDMIFVVSTISITGDPLNKIKVFSANTPDTLLYSFDTPKAYNGNSQYLCQLYYAGDYILYIASFDSSDEFETLYAIDIRTGLVVEQYTLETAGTKVGLLTTQMKIKNGLLYLFGTVHLLVIPLDGLSSEGITLSSCCTELSLESGLSTIDIDYSAGTTSVEGYVVTRNMTARAAIEPLLSTYEYALIERNHRLELRLQNQTVTAVIPEEDLGANLTNKLEYNIKQELDLIKSITLKYANSISDYQTSVQSARRVDTKAENELILELPLALTDTFAKELAEKTLYKSWLNRKTFKFYLPIVYKDLIVGDIITLNYNNYVDDVRLTSLTYAADKILECSAVANSSDIYSSTAIGQDTGLNAGTVVDAVSDTKLVLANTPSLSNNYINTEGFYVAASGYTDSWYGCNILSKAQQGDDLINELVVVRKSLIGQTYAALDIGPTHTWDLTNTINVSIISGTLTSLSTQSVLNGNNYILIGSEILQYTTATLIEYNKYTLSGLLRGRRGTEWAMDTHYFGELFVFLGAIDFIAKPIGNNNIYAVGSIRNNNINEYGTFLYNGENLKPLSISIDKGMRTSDININLEWMRRSRYISGYMKTLPIVDTPENYRIDVIQGSTLYASYYSSVESFSYTDTMATTDGIDFIQSITFNVMQVSSVYGDGQVTEILIPIGTVTAASYAELIINLGPQVYWKFDEASGNAIDYSGNGFSGTVFGTGVHGNSPIIPGGSETNFSLTKGVSAATDYVINTLAGNMDYSSYSYSLFIKLRNPDQREFVIQKVGTPGTYDLGIFNSSYSGADEYTTFVAYHKQNGLTPTATSFGVMGALDVWNHYAVTYDGSTFKTYLNGILSVSRTLLPITTDPTASDTIQLGKGWTTGIDADISNFSLLPVVMTQENIQDAIELSNIHLYNKDEYKNYALSLFPVNYWPQNETSGDIIDIVGTEDGTIGVDANYNNKNYLLIGDDSISRSYAFGTTHLETDLNTSLRFSVSSDHSISVRVLPIRPNYTGYTAALRIIVGSWDGSTGFYIGFTKTMHFEFRKTNTATTNDLHIQTTATFNPDKYYSVVVTYDGTGTAAGTKIYINGISESLTTFYDNLTSTEVRPGNTYIGAGSGNSSDAYKLWGACSSLIAFDKVLTATECSNMDDVANGQAAP